MKRIRLLILAGVLVMGLAPAPTTASGHVVVKATGSKRWNPSFPHVEPGQRVVWKNPTGRVHTVTSYGGGWSKDVRLARNGGKTGKTFNKEGVFRYRCKRHSTLSGDSCEGMCAGIHVAAT